MTTPQDAANTAVRAVLDEFGKKYGAWDDNAKNQTLVYFKNCCAYSGVPLKRDNNGRLVGVEWDHATPANRMHCVLTIMGNMLPVTRDENTAKGGRTFEDYLTDPNRQETLKAIQRFREEMQYPQDAAADLRGRLNLLYSIVIATVKAAIKDCVGEEQGQARRAANGRNASQLLKELRTFMENNNNVYPNTNAGDQKERSLANCCSSKVSRLLNTNEQNRTQDENRLIALWQDR